jgi:predicted Zn finger-like uncharacterized protein
MPVRAICPECGTEFDLVDHLAGKRVLCAKCSNAFQVPPSMPKPVDPPAASGDAPRRPQLEEEGTRRRRRRLDDNADWPRRRSSQGAPVGVLVGVVVGAVVLLIGAACGLGFYLSRPRPVPGPVAGGGPPVMKGLPPIQGRPVTAEDHFNVGKTLESQGLFQAAEASYRKALQLRPNYPEAHDALGGVLKAMNREMEAEKAFGEAIRLKADYVPAHRHLGRLLAEQARYKDAEVAYREAIKLKPDDGETHSNLANVLENEGRHKDSDEAYHAAELVYRDQLRRQPNSPLALCNLALALQNQGRLAEALAKMREGHDLGRMDPAWRINSGELLAHLESLNELDRRLPAILRGDDQPADAKECLELAWFCQRYKRLTRTVVLFSEKAFHDAPNLAENLDENRYNAACAAALAADGQGADARQLPDRVRVMLRRQALIWLRSDLKRYAALMAGNRLDSRPEVRRRMTHWLQDGDFNSVRGEALAKLPETERDQWRKLWDDVAAIRKRAEGAR